MALPLIAIASLATTAVGTLISSAASVRQGQQANAIAQYNAQVAEANKQRFVDQSTEIKTQISEQKTDIIEASSQSRMEMYRRMGAIRAGKAARGVVLDSGSPLATLIDDVTNMNLSIIDDQRRRLSNVTNLQNAEYDARWGAYQQDVNKTLHLASGVNALSAGRAEAVGTLLSGGSTFAANTINFKQNKII
jgi:hypothetical protein